MAKATKGDSLAVAGVRDLGLSPAVAKKLEEMQQEVNAQYRDAFVSMTQTIQQQASALSRIQSTLEVLIRAVAPTLEGALPPAVRISGDDEEADIATAAVVADPIGAGFTMSQSALSAALGVGPAHVSVLTRAFKLDKDPRCAVVVRSGTKRKLVNYHPRAVDRFRELVRNPPGGLTKEQESALKRVRQVLRSR